MNEIFNNKYIGYIENNFYSNSKINYQTVTQCQSLFLNNKQFLNLLFGNTMIQDLILLDNYQLTICLIIFQFVFANLKD